MPQWPLGIKGPWTLAPLAPQSVPAYFDMPRIEKAIELMGLRIKTKVTDLGDRVQYFNSLSICTVWPGSMQMKAGILEFNIQSHVDAFQMECQEQRKRREEGEWAVVALQPKFQKQWNGDGQMNKSSEH